MPNPNDIDPKELDEIHADIQRDISNGKGDRHFQDVLDELHSIPTTSAQESADERAELQRFYGQLRTALDDQIRSQGFRCRLVQSDGEGTGFVAHFLDSSRRPFDVSYTFDQGLRAAAQGRDNMGRAVITEILDKLLEARAKYFQRMTG
jgi:hypothetical protein